MVQSDVRVAPWGQGKGTIVGEHRGWGMFRGLDSMENSITCETASGEGQIIKHLRRYDSSGKTLRILNLKQH